MSTLHEWVDQLERALLAVDPAATRRLMAQASVTIPALQVLDAIIVPALERIGRYWERGEAALSQVYMSGRIIESLSSTLLPTASRPHPQHTTLAIAVLDGQVVEAVDPDVDRGAAAATADIEVEGVVGRGALAPEQATQEIHR